MFVYLRGASLSLAVATVVYYLFWVNSSGSWYHQDPSSTHDIFLLILAGCTYGFCVLGYLLFRILQRMNITNRVLRFILFALLGEVAALLLYVTVPLDGELHFITVLGAVVFGMSTFIRKAPYLLAAGPLIVLLASMLV